jgi:SAM-dependent methyltransferase
MHSTVMNWLASIKASSPEMFHGWRVLECGSYDINGSARSLFEDCEYIGLDWRPGPGVDVVGLVHEYQPDAPFDVVVSTEMLEHDPYWSASLRRMAEALRPGGVMMLTWASPLRPEHETHTAPVAQHYQGLHPLDVRDVVAPYFQTVQAGLARGDLDGWLLATGRLPAVRKLSVVIGTINQASLVNCCLDEVRERATVPLEIVLVDNGSTGKDAERLRKIAERKADIYLRYDDPLGYAAAYNAGVAASTGDYVMLLNNDAWPTQRDWDVRLIGVLEQVPDAMLVSPTMPRVIWDAQRASSKQASDCAVTQGPRIAFVAPLLRRSTWDSLGPLDTRFAVGGFEDNDYCERVLQAGGKILVDPAVWFFHVGGVTMAERYPDVLPGNKKLFLDKWSLTDDQAENLFEKG